MNNITHNISYINSRIAAACLFCGRNPKEVKLLLATKTVSADNILLALKCGATLIAENKVQELKEKYDAIKQVPHTTHFIGHLQTNKIKDVVKYAQCIQSVDSLELAKKLQQRLAFQNSSIDIFIQVNTSNEESKFGIAPENAIDFAQQLMQLDRLHIKGLMTIGLFSAEKEKVRKCYRLLKNIQLQMLSLHIPVHELSMGMSSDFEVAIEEGATIIRIGTSVFGKRKYPDSYYWNETK